MKKYSSPNFLDLLSDPLISSLWASWRGGSTLRAREILALKCFREDIAPGFSFGDVMSMPKDEAGVLLRRWWEGVASDEKEILIRAAKGALTLLLVIDRFMRPGAPIGDFFAVFSQPTSEEERKAALERFMEGRTPVVPEKWAVYQRRIESALEEDRPLGRTREEELRFRVAGCLCEVFGQMKDRPFSEAIVSPDEVVRLVFTKLSSFFLEHLLGPDRAKELKRQEHIRRRGKETPPDARELEMELAGAIFQKAVEATPEGGGEPESVEILSAFQRSDFARSLEAEFATRLQKREHVRAIMDRVQLNAKERDLLLAFMDEEPPEEIADRTGRTVEAIYTAKSRLLKKIKLSLPPR